MALVFGMDCVVVEIAGERLEVGGRTAAMMQYLARNSERVNVAEKGNVTFDFCEAEITPRISAIDSRITLNG